MKKTEYLGVSKQDEPFSVQIYIGRDGVRNFGGGTWRTIEEAAVAYDIFAGIFGKQRLNYPDWKDMPKVRQLRIDMLPKVYTRLRSWIKQRKRNERQVPVMVQISK